ncbi:MAG: MASE1 domain-containing protein, partial [Nitrospirota bacterium]|nr:MASE1 domain-containing protein [Nitrospirota bacterium]
MGVLFISYVLVAQAFSFFHGTLPVSPALIWPASGLALAGLILGGIRLWPAVALAAVIHQLIQGAGLPVALGVALGIVAQSVLAAWLLKRFGFRNTFARVPDTLIFILIALFFTICVPAIGTLTFLLTEPALLQGIERAFIPWWIGHILSVLIITPLLIRWLPRFSFTRRKNDFIEAWLSIITVAALGFLLYWTPFREIADVPLVYLILVPLLWIALRVGPRFMTLALFLNAAIALSGTAFLVVSSGNSAELGTALVQTEIYLIMISLIFLVLVTVAEERKDTANDLRENVRTLEDAVDRIRKEDEAKSRFIATIAHELRNPLAPLMSS